MTLFSARIFFALSLLLLTMKLLGNPFRFIVAMDGTGTHTSLQAAINDAPDHILTRIFIKKGVYNEQIAIGTHTAPSLKKISLIGEHRDSVVITGHRARNSTNGLTFMQVVTFQVYATDFYAENLTIQNTSFGNGQAEALFTGADRQTFNNVKIKGFQDTYRSRKGTRGYFRNSWIEGTVDFIYAGGVLFFDHCIIHCLPGGGYITAPEDAAFTIPRASTAIDRFLRLGFIFRNCDITAAPGVANNSYYLGRPWNVMAGSFFIQCRLGKHIHPAGWIGWNGNEASSSFAEFRNTDSEGNPIPTGQRVSWSFQLPEQDVIAHFTPQSVYARVSTTTYDPESLCVAPTPPTGLHLDGNVLRWTAAEPVAGYAIFQNGQFVGSTADNHFVPSEGVTGVFSIKSVGAFGQLSQTAVSTYTPEISKKQPFLWVANTLYFSEPAQLKLFHVSGRMAMEVLSYQDKISLNHLSRGVYVYHIRFQQGAWKQGKLNFTHNSSF